MKSDETKISVEPSLPDRILEGIKDQKAKALLTIALLTSATSSCAPLMKTLDSPFLDTGGTIFAIGYGFFCVAVLGGIMLMKTGSKK